MINAIAIYAALSAMLSELAVFMQSAIGPKGEHDAIMAFANHMVRYKLYWDRLREGDELSSEELEGLKVLVAEYAHEDAYGHDWWVKALARALGVPGLPLTEEEERKFQSFLPEC